MAWLWILPAAAVVVLVTAYICYRMAFYVPPRKAGEQTQPLSLGDIYTPYLPQMKIWKEEMDKLPHEQLQVTSFDGLTLYGKFYEYAPGAPIELMFHGYRGSAQRDLCGGVQRCFALGRSALVVDQRCCGRSQGKTITFGIHERRDCMTWLELMEEKFPDRKIILCGISMGASTVMMMADEELPSNVVGILADCGYSSAKGIIQKVIGDMHLPPKLAYPFVKLGARLFGGFDLEEKTPLDALKNSRLPVIFFHGEGDDFVPCDMSREAYDVCTSKKQLVTIPGAGHGLAYLADPETYLKELGAFFAQELA